MPGRFAAIRSPGLILFVIVATGAVLRFYDLSSLSLQLGESVSWRIAQLPWNEVAPTTALGLDPPLYYFLLKAWVSTVGDSVYAMRALSAILGTASILGIYLFVLEAYRDHAEQETKGQASVVVATALLAAALLAVNVSHITQSRRVEMHSLTILLAIYSSWIVLKTAHQHSHRAVWLAYVILAVALCYTHNQGFFIIVAQSAFLLGHLAWTRHGNDSALSRRSGVFDPVLALLLIGLLCSWRLPVFIAQWSRLLDQSSLPQLNLAAIGRVMEQLISPGLETSQSMGAAVSCAIPVLLGWLAATGRRADIMVCLLASVIFAVNLGISLTTGTNVLVESHLLLSLPFLIVAVAVIVRRVTRGRLAVALSAVLVIVSGGQNWPQLHVGDRVPRPGLRGAAEVLHSQLEKGDIVLVWKTYQYLGMTYYMRDRSNLRLLCYDGVRLSDCPTFLVDETELVDHRTLPDLPANRFWIVSTEGVLPLKKVLPEDWKLLAFYALREFPENGANSFLLLYSGR